MADLTVGGARDRVLASLQIKLELAGQWTMTEVAVAPCYDAVVHLDPFLQIVGTGGFDAVSSRRSVVADYPMIRVDDDMMGGMPDGRYRDLTVEDDLTSTDRR